MFEPKFAISNAILVDLTRIDGSIGFMSTAHLSDDWIRDMQANALTVEAHYTTHIEGTKLTLEQSTQLLALQTVPEADPNDVRELLNYRTAFELVAEYIGSSEPITEALIREIHKRLVTDVHGGSAAPEAKLRVSRSTLQRHLRSLIEAGFIRAVQSSTHNPTAHYEANI